MESSLKIVLLLTAVFSCTLSAPTSKRDAAKLNPAPCPEAKTGKYIVILDEPDGPVNAQRESEFLSYMEKMVTKAGKDDYDDKHKPLLQVSKAPEDKKSNDTDQENETEKDASVKKYTYLGFGMYLVEMNDPALKEVLGMNEVETVEEEARVHGANPCEDDQDSGSTPGEPDDVEPDMGGMMMLG